MNLSELTVEQKRELARRLLKERAARPDTEYPLSHGQLALWFASELARAIPLYNVLHAVELPAGIDASALRRACQAVVDRHPSLRTVFESRDGRPVQRVLPQAALPWQEAVADGDPGELLRRVRAEADRPFDLRRDLPLRASLYRRPDGRLVLALVGHHVVADFWSVNLIVHELRLLYAAEAEGRAADLPPPRGRYADFVRWEQDYVASPAGQAALRFWQRALAGPLPALQLPTDRPRPRVLGLHAGEHRWDIDRDVTARLRDFARRRNTSPFVTVLAALQVLLSRYGGQEDVIVGTAVAGRSRADWETVVGYFINQVAVRADLTGQPTFASLLQQTRQAVLQALEHRDYPFSLLVEKLQPARDTSRTPIFQALFTWDKTRHLSESDGGVAAGRHDAEPLITELRGSPFDLALIVFEDDHSIRADLRYNTDLFEAATAARMAGHLMTLLAAALDDPDRRVGELPMLTPAELQQLRDWNDTSHGPPQPPTAHPRVEELARRRPDARALEFEDRVMSYGEMNRRANQLARRLRRRGVGPGRVIGICLNRSPEMIVALLAAWKAGAAYVALDPLYPPRRLAWMAEDCRLSVALTHPGAAPPAPAVEALELDESWAAFADEDGSDPGLPVAPLDLAYVCYTSGSTGAPKGVLIPHRGVANLCEGVLQHAQVWGGRRVLLLVSFNFDAALHHILMALITGGTLVLPGPSAALSGADTVELLRRRRINFVAVPPSMLGMWPAAELPDLEALGVGGEACPAALVRQWARGRTMLNLYGPTETTVCVTVATCVPDGSPPIGRPAANVRCHVLDSRRQPVPVGVPGELYVGGPSVGLGYLNEPELTAGKFVANPLAGGPDDTLYRTGDVVRWRADGQLEFLGRVDQQVKLRGYRIEPGEVEGVLRQHPAVRDAAVLFRPADERGPKRLVAFVVADGGTVPADLSAFLRERLPYYMLPGAVVPLDVMPLSPNGKADRAALARRDAEAGPAPARTPPRTEAERTMARIWAGVLRVEGVGVEDNFFTLGGASIQTLEVVNLARQAGLQITPEMIFRHQTLGELAAAATPLSSPLAAGPGGQADRTQYSGLRTQTPLSPGPSPSGGRGEMDVGRTLIESLGVYLPPRVVETSEVLAGCRRPLQFPLERFTGIRSRRMAGETEFSIDLAANAVAACLRRSSHRPEDVDLIVCCNISRYDGPGGQWVMEPTAAARLRQKFGLVNALAFDVSNACAGAFTGVALADAFLQAGAARRALVVSGEYVTHLTRTAQQEITGFMDPRLACLTVGDAGCALLLERSGVPGAGFHHLDMVTRGEHHRLCVAKLSRDSVGAVMVTDAVRGAALAIGESVRHATAALAAGRWDPDRIDHLILHQTSETTIDGAVQEINRVAGKRVCHRDNVAYNVAERGNTGSTTHWVALDDAVRAGRVRSGHRLMFGISGSGQTIGTALYQLDDLPERLRADAKPARRPEPPPATAPEARFRVAAVGTLPDDAPADTTALLRDAGEACLRDWGRDRSEIDLILSAGVYRTEFLSEPALASIAAGELGINHTSAAARRSLAFDLMNGAAGPLTACHAAAQMMRARGLNGALILASEVENNADVWPDNLLGLKPTASALVLERSDGPEGFGRFIFRHFPEHLGRFRSWTVLHDGRPALTFPRDPALDDAYVDCVAAAVREFLAAESLTPGDLRVVLPPHRSRAFVTRLAEALRCPEGRVASLPDGDRDYFTSSLAWGFRRVRERRLAGPGDLGLVIAAGAGLCVGCALYRF